MNQNQPLSCLGRVGSGGLAPFLPLALAPSFLSVVSLSCPGAAFTRGLFVQRSNLSLPNPTLCHLLWLFPRNALWGLIKKFFEFSSLIFCLSCNRPKTRITAPTASSFFKEDVHMLARLSHLIPIRQVMKLGADIPVVLRTSFSKTTKKEKKGHLQWWKSKQTR